MNTYNNTHSGLVIAINFIKEQMTIEVAVQTEKAVFTLKHKVGAKEGVSAQASRQLWIDLNKAMMTETPVSFMHRGDWSAWFDAIEEYDEIAALIVAATAQ